MDETLSRSARGKRANLPVETTRHLVEQTFESGASVSLIARGNDVNTNLLFRWRRQYLEGVFGAPCPTYAAAASKREPDAGAPALLPVSVVAEPSEATPTSHETNSLSGGVCEVEFDRARVRICGEVSPAILRLLIRELAR